MEDTLGADKPSRKRQNEAGLNPCFNGRYSRRSSSEIILNIDTSLNPCFNGRYSRSNSSIRHNLVDKMSLNPCFNGRYSRSTSNA